MPRHAACLWDPISVCAFTLTVFSHLPHSSSARISEHLLQSVSFPRAEGPLHLHLPTPFVPIGGAVEQWLQNKQKLRQMCVCPSGLSLTLQPWKDTKGVLRHLQATKLEEDRSHSWLLGPFQPSRQLHIGARVINTDPSTPLAWLVLQDSQMPLRESPNSSSVWSSGPPQCPLMHSVSPDLYLPYLLLQPAHAWIFHSSISAPRLSDSWEDHFLTLFFYKTKYLGNKH